MTTTTVTATIVALMPLIYEIVRLFAPMLLQTKNTMSDADAKPEIREALKEKIRRTIGTSTKVFVIGLLLVGSIGCRIVPSHETIFIPNDVPVRLAKNVKASVWVYREGQPVLTKTQLGAGMWVLSLTAAEMEELGLNDPVVKP